MGVDGGQWDASASADLWRGTPLTLQEVLVVGFWLWEQNAEEYTEQDEWSALFAVKQTPFTATVESSIVALTAYQFYTTVC